MYSFTPYIFVGDISQHTGNHKALPNFGKMLAYSLGVEISRRFHKSFVISWKVVEVKVLGLWTIVEYN